MRDRTEPLRAFCFLFMMHGIACVQHGASPKNETRRHGASLKNETRRHDASPKNETRGPSRVPREQWQVPEAVSEHWEGVSEVKRKACAQAAVTDKVTAGHALGGHAYNLMYGMFLHPLRHKSLKMLEIGLGCGMTYGAGASAHLWRTLLPEAELWEAEIAEKCVEQHRRKLEQQGIHPLIGSARDPATLQHWMNISGGRFDVIIDDGGHTNLDITTAFDHLWGHLQPGGLYFVERLHR